MVEVQRKSFAAIAQRLGGVNRRLRNYLGSHAKCVNIYALREMPTPSLLPSTRQGILAATLVQPGKAWYVSELACRMGVLSSSLQRELQDLTEAGILKSHRQARMVCYQANPDSPLFPDLRGLPLKTAGLVDVLREALKPLVARITLAFVYGSIASGQERSESDIDLMVIGSISPADLALPLRRAREQLGREVNPTAYSVNEFNRKRVAKDHFLSHVLTSPRLIVLGPRCHPPRAARS